MDVSGVESSWEASATNVLRRASVASRRVKASWIWVSIVLSAWATRPVSLRLRPAGTRRSMSPAAIASAVAAISSKGRVACLAKARPSPPVSSSTPSPTATSTTRRFRSVSRIGLRDAVTTMAPPLIGSTDTRSSLPPLSGVVVRARACGWPLSPECVAIAATTGPSCGGKPPGSRVAGTGSNADPSGCTNSTKSSGPAALRALVSSDPDGPPGPGPSGPPLPGILERAASVEVSARAASASCASRRLMRKWLTDRYVTVPKTARPAITRAASPVSRRRRSDIAYSRGIRRMYPTPRTVWIRGGCSASIFLRR